MSRSKAVRERARTLHRATGMPCWICGKPINYNAPHLDPGEFVVDHIVPYAKGGPDTLENKQAAHRSCNQAKYDKLPESAVRTFVTDRVW